MHKAGLRFKYHTRYNQRALYLFKINLQHLASFIINHLSLIIICDRMTTAELFDIIAEAPAFDHMVLSPVAPNWKRKPFNSPLSGKNMKNIPKYFHRFFAVLFFRTMLQYVCIKF